MPAKSIWFLISCEQCRKQFTVKPSKATSARFCSWECKNTHHGPPPIVKHCKQCDVAFTSHVSKQKQFCSNACRHQALTIDSVSRFWSYVEKTTSCWLWKGPLNFGYGRFNPTHSKAIAAHRFSYQLHYGPIPPEGCVLHNCPDGDNRACVNPAHLWLGTKPENNTDRHNKGRDARGEHDGNAKLTEEAVRQIRSRYHSGVLSQQEIANDVGISQTTVSDIVRSKTWKHINL